MACSLKYNWIEGRLMGSGGFAQVYLAKYLDPESGTPKQLAIKRALLEDSSTLQKEANVLSALSPHCPDILDFYGHETTAHQGEGGAFFNLFLEYAPAGSLQDLIRKSPNPGLPNKDIRAYTRMILKALRFMHDRSYIHFDIKPDNVLAFPSDTEPGYRLKLADFGLTKEPQEELKVAGGTKKFMPPEALYENKIGAAMDIWALGCTVVVMATGKLECDWFEGVYGSALIPKDMDEEGKNFLRKCFITDPERRWTAQMLMHHPYVYVPPPPPPPPNRNFRLPLERFHADTYDSYRNANNASNDRHKLVPELKNKALWPRPHEVYV